MIEPGMNELKALVAVSDRRSFRGAAAELGVSASGLSHAVATLEARMGVRLLNRTTRSVALTPAGKRFLDRVRPALQSIDEAVEGVNDHRATPAGTLRINASEIAAERMVGAILSFLNQFPDMQVEIVVEGRFVDLAAEGFDAGVRIAEAVPQDMISVAFVSQQRHVVVASPSYLAEKALPLVPSDLDSHACIRSRMPGGAIFRWEFEKHGEVVKLDVPGRFVANNYHVMLDAVLAGGGIGYIVDWLTVAALSEGRLVQLLDDWTPPYPGLCIYFPRHRHITAGLRAFVDHVRAFRAA